MSRNVTILVIILALVLLAFYLVWLRGRFQVSQQASPAPEATVVPSPTPEVTITPVPTATATPSAVPTGRPAATPRTATPGGRIVR